MSSGNTGANASSASCDALRVAMRLARRGDSVDGLRRMVAPARRQLAAHAALELGRELRVLRR